MRFLLQKKGTQMNNHDNSVYFYTKSGIFRV